MKLIKPLFLIITLISSIHAQVKSSLYNYQVKDLKEQTIELSKYKNHVALVVNTASRCGHTPQFDDLQKIYEKYKDQKFIILGFPSNDFKQEDLEGKKIGDFCRLKYGVTFPMLSKTHVNGSKRHPVFQYLIEKSQAPKEDISWNFEKFLIDRSGQVIGRYKSKIRPTSDIIISTLKEALKESK